MMTMKEITFLKVAEYTNNYYCCSIIRTSRGKTVIWMASELQV